MRLKRISGEEARLLCKLGVELWWSESILPEAMWRKLPPTSYRIHEHNNYWKGSPNWAVEEVPNEL